MIKSVLVANRGEIAVRVLRACRELGIRSVLAYSEADRDSLGMQLADETVCIGPAPSHQSYLNSRNIVTAALLTRCEAVHPGVGFLSENAAFAQAVTEAGLTFIGPRAETIALLGDKVAAKRSAIKAGVPVIPGSDGPVSELADALAKADEMGYPVIVKAASGGGGKGMRIVRSGGELERTLGIASAEAEKAFGDGTVYLEKYLERPRHVELQLMADRQGGVIHLGERDCTVQENHQKLVEESPSPGIDPTMRDRMGTDAVQLFADLRYVGAGTIEFLVEDGRYYFMEVNARVQVEHPVTELVTGMDIITEQLRVCSGDPLSVSQDDIQLRGHAIEVRINARAPGTVTDFRVPGGFGVRMDSFLYNGYSVPPHYDALLAKLLVHGETREIARKRMLRALDELRTTGVPTNQDLQRTIIGSRIFASGDFATDALARIRKEAQQ